MGNVLKISHLFFALSLFLSLLLGDKVLGMFSEPRGGGAAVERAEVAGKADEKDNGKVAGKAAKAAGKVAAPALEFTSDDVRGGEEVARRAKKTLSPEKIRVQKASTESPREGGVKEAVAKRIFTPPDIFRGGIERMELSFTFDGGAGAKETEEILTILKRHGLKTTIFLTGQFIEIYPELVHRMIRDGHEIGNHTMTHPHLTTYNKNSRHHTLPGVDRQFIIDQLLEPARRFRELTGKEMVPFWRAPYGEVNGNIRRWAYEAGYLHINWTRNYKRQESLDSLDWVNDAQSRLYYSSEGIKKRILNFDKGGDGLRGGIVLMHLGTERRVDRAVDTLGETLAALEKRGYRFVKISELLQRQGELSAAIQKLAQRQQFARLPAPTVPR